MVDWLIFGACLAFASCVFACFGKRPTVESPLLILGFLLFGLPYALTSLMISFLHDALGRPPLPASSTPCCAMVSPFSPSSFKVSAILALGGVAFGLASILRDRHFGLYLVMALGCWGFAIWISLVTMRVLGLHYHRHRDRLKWQHADPRWGVSWRHLSLVAEVVEMCADF